MYIGENVLIFQQITQLCIPIASQFIPNIGNSIIKQTTSNIHTYTIPARKNPKALGATSSLKTTPALRAAKKPNLSNRRTNLLPQKSKHTPLSKNPPTNAQLTVSLSLPSPTSRPPASPLTEWGAPRRRKPPPAVLSRSSAWASLTAADLSRAPPTHHSLSLTARAAARHPTYGKVVGGQLVAAAAASEAPQPCGGFSSAPGATIVASDPRCACVQQQQQQPCT